MKTKLMQPATIIVLLLILFTTNVKSQNIWLPVNGPYGGPVYEFIEGSISYDFCITPAGIFRTSDSGNMWHQSSTLDMRNLYKGDVDNNGNIYAATTNYTTLLYRSTDNGSSWQQSLDGGLDFNAVTASPNGSIFAGTFYMFSFHGQFIQDGEIFRSTNRGATWSVMNFPHLAVSSLKINSNGDVFVATTDGLFRSINNGASFNLIRSGSAGSIFLNSQNHIFISTVGNLVFRSTDNGSSWTQISSGNELKMPVAEDWSGNIYSIVSGQIYKSTDNGSNWSLHSVLPANGYYEFNSMNFLSGGEVIITTSVGMFRSNDNGITWSKANNGLRDPQVRAIEIRGQTIFTGSYSNFSRSSDNGNSWSELTNGLPAISPQQIETGDDGIVFANITPGGLYRSFDNGNTWSQLSITPPEIVSHMKTLPGNKIFITTYSGTILKSTNNGDNWSDATSNLPDSIEFLAFTSDNTGNLYASIQRGSWTNPLRGIYKSENEGASWTELNLIYSPEEIKFSAQNIMFIKLGTSLLHSTNGGIDFVNTVPVDQYVLEFAVGSSSQIFISSVKNEIYKIEKSTNNGQTWEDYTGILNNELINGLEFDAQSHLIAITQSGLFRTMSPTSVVSNQNVTPESFVLKQNYPNPFNPSTTISYELNTEDKVSLRVYDAGGKEVAILVDEIQKAGYYAITFEPKNLSSGVYFYALTTDKFVSTRKMMLLK